MAFLLVSHLCNVRRTHSFIGKGFCSYGSKVLESSLQSGHQELLKACKRMLSEPRSVVVLRCTEFHSEASHTLSQKALAK